MANVKLKKKKGDGGYEQLYPVTLAKNVITGTGNADTDILVLRQRIQGLEYIKTPLVIEVEERYSDGTNQFYDASGWQADKFNNTEANLKIVFNETNKGQNIFIEANDSMGMTMTYEILGGLYNRKFEDGEIKAGKIYDLLYYNYQFYLMDSDSTVKDMKKQVNYLSGAEYKDNNEFGSDLKNITEGQMYYYGNKPYMAIKTASNTTGFLVPDSTNFIDISNKSLNNSRNLHEQMIFGNEMWRAMLINTNTPYAAPAGYKLKSISAIHPGTVTSIVFSVNTAAGNQQYQLNSNYPATVACMVIVVFEKI